MSKIYAGRMSVMQHLFIHACSLLRTRGRWTSLVLACAHLDHDSGDSAFDPRALRLQPIASGKIPTQVEGTSVPDQCADHRSRSARLRSALRARLIAAARSRARRSEGFS